MKQQNAIVNISLNILFCIILLWYFSKNAFLRPYLGSTAREFLSGLLLLSTLYANYFALYPKLYRNHTTLYWLSIVTACLVAGGVELALGYPFISQCYALRIKEVGAFNCFSKLLFLIICRNLAFNFFPFMLGERKQLRESLETEVRVVYRYARLIDACDGRNNCSHIPIDDIFYCKKNGNETEVYTVSGIKYTRYCTIKYLIHLLDNKEFIRISKSIIVPFQHIASCDGEVVVMKPVPWAETPLSFKLDAQRHSHISDVINEYLHTNWENMDGIQPDIKEEKEKRNPSVPPKEKLDAVLNYILEHPGCRSTEIASRTKYPQTTLERCIAVLKRQGFIEYTGSKKTGGYHLTGKHQNCEALETVQPKEMIVEEKDSEKKRN